jgi:Tfp pilus assembly protein PilX
MDVRTNNSRGFTLIATLLLVVMLSGIAIGLMFMVGGRGRAGSNDLEANEAYYGAESGMEKLTAELGALYQSTPSPTNAQLTAVGTNDYPTASEIGAMTYNNSVTWTADSNGNPISRTAVITQGSDAGLTAEIIPLTLQVNATRPSGANVNMTRGVEVALIPVFQFGVFSASDLSYFAGPQFGFQGRVHTNGNLFLAANSGPLVLDGKITAVGQIVRDYLANGYNGPAAGAYTGSVYVPNTTGGCDTLLYGGAAGANCLDFGADSANATNDASWSGGVPPSSGTANPNWVSIATGTFNSMIGNSATGVTPLQLPFVQGTTNQQIQIIRKPPAGESPTSAIGASREYNKATIRILLASTQADLHPERGLLSDGQDVDLTNGGSSAGMTVNVNGVGAQAFGMALAGVDPYWVASPTGVAGTTPWNLVDGWLRVEYMNSAGVWTGVTTEWLGLGFARGLLPPVVPLTGNAVNPHAILLFQEPADRNGDGTITLAADSPTTGINSWYPINFFDPREGYPRDPGSGSSFNPGLSGTQCFANGVMDAVELDVGNLQQWLLGNIGTSGTSVGYLSQNGYLLYYSDRRGMEPDPNISPIATSGESGLEDVINSSSGTGTPDGVLDPLDSAYTPAQSPEDVDDNGLLDNWGGYNIGQGFRVNLANSLNPYQKLDCFNGGRQNIVTGARHVLRLVDGGLNNLPVRPDTKGGGFTVAAENPVYVWGNYNSNNTDPFWTNPQITTDIPHSAAAVIADTVTLLSNGYSDLLDMQNTLNMGARTAEDTYYRTAIAAGKNMNFPQPSGTAEDFGTDGGVHNFLRYIENWNPGSSSICPIAGGQCVLSYRGSMVSLYYAQYATGAFKCCSQVYSPPKRNYYFDSEFLTPANLPPGTPMLQDVVNLSYWQNFQAY